MITGDAEAVAASVAAELGIDRYFAGVRPEDKAAKVAAAAGRGPHGRDGRRRRQRRPGAGAGRRRHRDRRRNRRRDRLGRVSSWPATTRARCCRSSSCPGRATARCKQNLWWAAGYNLISVPLAAGVLAPIGFVLPMSVGAILMSVSTIVVALNAQLLRRLDLRPAGLAACGLRRTIHRAQPRACPPELTSTRAGEHPWNIRRQPSDHRSTPRRSTR